MATSNIFIVISFLCMVSYVNGLYLPPAIFGVPLNSTVNATSSDFTGQDTFRINFWVHEKDSGQDVAGFIHRSYSNFQEFDAQIPWYYKFDLPQFKTATITSINDYMQRVFRKRALLDTELFSDFLGINWDGSNSLYMRDFATFMKMLTIDRVPIFAPEPPVFHTDSEAVTETLCPFENYIFLKSFRNDDIGINSFLDYYAAYVDSLPAFGGPHEDFDVWPEGVTKPIGYPYHYVTTQVHFNPGGYINGHTARMSFSTQNKFNFLQSDKLKEWFGKLHGHLRPDSILDLGTGNGFSAMEMAKLFPDATVIGIDLAAPYVRFARHWKEALGLTNVFFFQGNAESLPNYESNTFDIIQYTYVLHEMPFANAKKVLREAYRLLRPGGVLSGFDVTYWENAYWREVNVENNTWGIAWNDTSPDVIHGPEPYMEEYQLSTRLPHLLMEIGFVNPVDIRYSNFDGIYIVHKPLSD